MRKINAYLVFYFVWRLEHKKITLTITKSVEILSLEIFNLIIFERHDTKHT